MSLAETPWVDQTLAFLRPALERSVPAAWLPRQGAAGVEEYGCGGNGCVMPTRTPGLVMKLTKDVSEITFVAHTLELYETGFGHEGIVKYEKVFAVPPKQPNRTPLFILWRTEAKDVGAVWGADEKTLAAAFFLWGKAVFIDYSAKLREARHNSRTLALREKLMRTWWNSYMEVKRDHEDDIDMFQGILHFGAGRFYDYEMYLLLQKLSGRRILRREDMASFALLMCWWIAGEMEKNFNLSSVGHALRRYLDRGLLIQDIHKDNIGLESDMGSMVIRDAGTVVEFHPQWAAIPLVHVLRS